jgi:hypothetical protein
MAEKEERGFVVIDRRGQEYDEQAEATSSGAPASSSEGPEAGAAGQAEPPLPKIDFSTFILSLSTSALYHLGLVPDPETGKPAAPNAELARQSIDTLELLEEKTRGNLEPAEQSLLENLLYELRLRFVELSG